MRSHLKLGVNGMLVQTNWNDEQEEKSVRSSGRPFQCPGATERLSRDKIGDGTKAPVWKQLMICKDLLDLWLKEAPTSFEFSKVDEFQTPWISPWSPIKQNISLVSCYYSGWILFLCFLDVPSGIDDLRPFRRTNRHRSQMWNGPDSRPASYFSVTWYKRASSK